MAQTLRTIYSSSFTIDIFVDSPDVRIRSR
jgi:hypothetical protein